MYKTGDTINHAYYFDDFTFFFCGSASPSSSLSILRFVVVEIAIATVFAFLAGVALTGAVGVLVTVVFVVFLVVVSLAFFFTLVVVSVVVVVATLSSFFVVVVVVVVLSSFFAEAGFLVADSFLPVGVAGPPFNSAKAFNTTGQIKECSKTTRHCEMKRTGTKLT